MHIGVYDVFRRALALIRDSSRIHDKIYRAAPLFLQPGKTLYQITLEQGKIRSHREFCDPKQLMRAVGLTIPEMPYE